MAAEITLTKALRPLVMGFKKAAPTLSHLAKPHTPPQDYPHAALSFTAKKEPSSMRFLGLFQAYASLPKGAQVTFRSFDRPFSSLSHSNSEGHPAAAEDEDSDSISLDDDSAIDRSETPTSDLSFNSIEFLEEESEAPVDLTPLKAELRATQRHLDAREEDLTLAHVENAQLRAQNRALKAKANAQAQELDALREQLRIAEQAYTHMEARALSADINADLVDSLTHRLENAEALLQSTKRNLEDNRSLHAQTSSEAHESIQILTQKLAEKERTLSQLERELRTALSKNEQLTKALEEVDAGSEELLVELDDLREASKSKIGALSQELEALQAELADLKAESSRK